MAADKSKPETILTGDSSSPAIAVCSPPDISTPPNPWDEEQNNEESIKRESKPVSIDSSLFEQQGFSSLNTDDSEATPKGNSSSKEEILNEFDPLASMEEKAARDAWEKSEGHLPQPPRTPSPPVPPMRELYIPSPTGLDGTQIPSPGPSIASPTPFSSFATFAKSIAFPLVKSLPFDGSAKPMPSTTSSAYQQDGSDTGKSVASVPTTPHRAGGGEDDASALNKPADGTFDFQRFLDQMKMKGAEPVSRYLRSFLSNFAKRMFTVNDQVKIIADFLAFIAVQMRECDVWRNCSEIEFDNAMEGMEKLVMNRLYDFTFTPQLLHANPPRPITTDDLERDRVLSQRIALFSWLEEKHLDVQEGEGSKGFLMFAQQELLKINHYKAPRDKLICVLNCCKVIYGLLRHLGGEENADSFLPVLIFVVLKANPEHLLSNVEFINRFRNPAKLQSEAGYYLSSLMGAVSFIETMDHASLSHITQEEFEMNVELAIRTLPPSEPHSPMGTFAESKVRGYADLSSPHAGEESARPLAISTPSHTLSEDAKRLLQKTGDTISKPLSAIGRIFSEALDEAENKLSSLPVQFAPFESGRESKQEPPESAPRPGRPPPLHLNEGVHATPHTPYNSAGPSGTPIQTPYKQRIKKVVSPVYTPTSPGYSPASANSAYDTPSRTGPYTNQALALGPSQPVFGLENALLPPRVQTLAGGGDAGISRTPTPALDLAGVQAQIDLAHEQVASASRATLRQIFPSVDLEVVDWVLEANEGDLGKSIEQLLEIGGSGS